ncbi:hypothetical protein M433DRAFT_157547 [Acidomyces richmondensis BFW]|nr:hypothetical protein M433DRAFT_157547 [Acidomyces richmondensis BFW]
MLAGKGLWKYAVRMTARRTHHVRNPRACPIRIENISYLPVTCRTFSSSSCLSKKGGKAARDEKQHTNKTTGDRTPNDDPFDFSHLDSEIATAIERLKSDLSKLRAGGRFNPDIVEGLRVRLDKSGGGTARLGDLAQVIPKGRALHVLVGEQDHVKPLSTAIAASNLSLTPLPDPTGTNPLLLVINIPPPTAETRHAAVNEATRAGDRAKKSVHDARAAQHKKHRAIQLAKTARPDDLKKASMLMEKLVERANGEVKRIVDGARKALEAA